MRRLILLILLAGCPEHGKSPDGGVRDMSGIELPIVDVPGSSVCLPSGGCTEGPACGAGCCGFGEQCIGSTCLCGMDVACTGGDTCQPGGPSGGEICGRICCGSQPHPCPL